MGVVCSPSLTLQITHQKVFPVTIPIMARIHTFMMCLLALLVMLSLLSASNGTNRGENRCNHDDNDDDNTVYEFDCQGDVDVDVDDNDDGHECVLREVLSPRQLQDRVMSLEQQVVRLQISVVILEAGVYSLLQVAERALESLSRKKRCNSGEPFRRFSRRLKRSFRRFVNFWA